MDSDEAYISCEINGERKRFDIGLADLCGIGRSDHNRIVLSDPLTSRDHAMIRRDNAGRCYLADTGSSNGTTLNGRPVTVPTLLSDGDTISIGHHRLKFHEPSARAPKTVVEPVQSTQISFAQSLVTVLVMDVRNYTVIAREIGEERISALMAEIFRSAGQLLTQKRSWSQKYIGDAIMGVWVHEQQVIETAELADIIDIISQLRQLFPVLQARYQLTRPLSFGAAINTGYASIGNMGSAALADFTALGDTVNKAFRLETATKELGTDFILGRSVIEFLVPTLQPEQRPRMADAHLKGYDQPERLYMLGFDEVEQFKHVVATARESTTLLRHETHTKAS
jgi:adenylate cyclase